MTTLFDFLTDPDTGVICLGYGALLAWVYYPTWRRRLHNRRRHEAWTREPFGHAAD